MSFDRSKSADLLALKTEFNTDPTGMDYAAVSSDTKGLLKTFNDPKENVNGDSINRPTEELDIPDIAAVIDAGEFALLSEYDQSWVRMFINKPVTETLKPYQTKMLQLFDANSVTRIAILALRSKPASRSEVLFGVNTVISRGDWIAARSS